MSKRKLSLLGLSIALFFGFVQTSFAAEKLVGLQSAPTIAMALPWFAEEARLYPKYDLDSACLHRLVGDRDRGDE